MKFSNRIATLAYFLLAAAVPCCAEESADVLMRINCCENTLERRLLVQSAPYDINRTIVTFKRRDRWSRYCASIGITYQWMRWKLTGEFWESPPTPIQVAPSWKLVEGPEPAHYELRPDRRTGKSLVKELREVWKEWSGLVDAVGW